MEHESHTKNSYFEILVVLLSIEKTRFAGNIADVVTREIDDTYTIYEIKTSISARKNIREALGQLLDYTSHAGTIVVSKIVIVSPAVLSANDQLFLDRLRSIIRYPISYLQYIESNAGKGPVFSIHE